MPANDDPMIIDYPDGGTPVETSRTTVLDTFDDNRAMPMDAGATAAQGWAIGAVIDPEAAEPETEDDRVFLHVVTTAGDFASAGWINPITWGAPVDDRTPKTAHLTINTLPLRHVVFPCRTAEVPLPGLLVVDVNSVPTVDDVVALDETDGKIDAIAPLPNGWIPVTPET